VPERYLYYAGMADDLVTEQIGLAVSRADGAFVRAGEAGLIIRCDEACPWRALRVCNPTVLREGQRFVMYYQGIGRGLQHTAIGRATSDDGIDWVLDDEPLLDLNSMRGVDPALDPERRVGLAEPSVVRDGETTRMMFVYVHDSQPGNSLWQAESSDGRDWSLAAAPVLSGSMFGDFAVHYPQLQLRDDGFKLWFTLRDGVTGVDGIFVAQSQNGVDWSEPRQVLPVSSNGRINLDKARITPRPLAAIAERNSFSRRVVEKIEREVAQRRRSGNELGYAHPHVFEAEGEGLIAVHNVNLGPKGRWLDISLGRLNHDRVSELGRVLEVGPPGTWDAFFVGDPFVLVT
jgi:hypothetical protein